MADQGSGLQTSRFSESFQKNENQNDVYVTEHFLNRTIANYLNTNSVVNLNIGDGVTITSTVTGSTETVVNVGLDASLNELNNVNANPSGADAYLKWDGTSWVAGTGVSLQDLKITNLSDVGSCMGMHTYLHSHNGVSAVFIEDDNIKIDYLNASNGLTINKGSGYPRSAQITTDFSSFQDLTTDTGLSSGHYIFVTPGASTMKISKSEIDVTEFKNFVSGVSSVIISGMSSTNLTSFPPGLTNVGGQFNLNLSNYLTGAGGILPISQGGTSGGTSEEARAHLGLCYNHMGTCYPYDIMGYSQPIFRDHMLGDSIRLVSGLSSSSVLTGGSGYDPNTVYHIISENGTSQISVNVTTGAGGSVVSVSLTDPYNGFPYIYNDYEADILPSLGDTARIGISAAPSYINFGMSYGESGIGFRNSNGSIEVRNSSAALWERVNIRFGVSELADVNGIAGFNSGDVLVYGASSFFGVSITGDISIDASGVATITTGGLSVGQINFGTPAPGVS